MCVACMYVYHMCACCPWGPKEGPRFPETGVTGGCELSDVLELNSGPGAASSPHAFSQKLIVLEFRPMTHSLVRFVNSVN